MPSSTAPFDSHTLTNDKDEYKEKDDSDGSHNANELFQRDSVASGDDQLISEGGFCAIMARGVDWTQTLEASDDVDTSSSIMTRGRLAFVDINRAQISSESTAFAYWANNAFLANASVLAWIRVTMAAILAAFSAQTSWTFATVIVIQIVALAIVEARR